MRAPRGRRSQHGRWWVCAIALTAAFASVSIGGATAAPGPQASPGAQVRVVVRAAARTVPGGAAEVLVAVANDGRDGTSAGEPVTLTLTPPAGFSFMGSTDLDRSHGLGGYPQQAGTSWRCFPAHATVTCKYERGGVPAAIPGESAVALLVGFHVNATRRPGPAQVGVSLSAPGNIATGGRAARATIDVSTGAPSPQLFPDVGGTPRVHVGGQAVETIELLNVGSGPARSIRLSNLLPPTLVGGWSASGAGWSCAGVSPTCTMSRAVAVGGAAPRLTLRYRLDPARAARLALRPGVRDSIQRWTIGLAAAGASGGSSISTYPAQIAVAPPPGSDLLARAVAAGGRNQLLPGSSTRIEVTLTNLGDTTTTGQIVLRGSVPSGVAVAGGSAWQCSTRPRAARMQDLSCSPTAPLAVAPAHSARLELDLAAASDASPGDGAIVLRASAGNQSATAQPPAASVPIFILRGDAGFPALTLLRATGASTHLQPALDGSPAALKTGMPFTERLDVRDAGGAPIAPGSRAELVQSFGPGVSVRSVRTPPGWRCVTSTTPTTRLSCTLAFGVALAPAASVEGPTVTVVPSRAAPAGTSWPATVRLAPQGGTKPEELPVLVSVNEATASLVPNFAIVRLPTAGGTGVFVVSVRNDGDGATRRPVELGLHLPPGVHVGALDAPGWRCVVAIGSARCESRALLDAGHALPRLRLSPRFGAGTAGHRLTLTVHASDGAGTAPRSSRATIDVVPRHPLRAVIKAPTTVTFDDRPLVSANQPLTPSVVTLEGDGSGGSGLGLRYTWAQRCTSTLERGCSSVAPSVRWLNQAVGTTHPATADVSFAAPAVTRLTVLSFRLTVTDGSATSTATVRVRVVPLPAAQRGFALQSPHPRPTRALGPSSERRKLPRPAQPLRKPRRPSAARARNDTPPPSTTTDTTTTGTTTGETTTADTTTQTTTATTTEPPTTTTAPPGPSALFCELVRDAVNGHGAFSASLPGGVSLHLREVRISGSACTSSTVVRFGGASIALDSFLRATDVAGSIDAHGIELTAGTIEGPSAWHAPPFTIRRLAVTLPGSGDVAVEGNVTSHGFAFIPLPSGWSGSTTLDFGGGRVALSANATGPARDTSPDSPRPKIVVEGDVSSDGTFSLSVDAERMVQLQGHTFAINGTIARSRADGPIAVTLSGSLPEPFDIVPGLSVHSLRVKIAPTETSLNLEGGGTIELKVPSGTLDVGVKLRYDNPANWSLTADGGGSGSWAPVPGLTLTPGDVHGAITARDDAYAFSLRLEPGRAWTPTSGVSVANLKLELGNTCPDTGAPCPTDAAVFLRLSGDGSFELPAVGTVTANVAGVLALPSGDFSVAATLPSAIRLGAGISIDGGRIEISHGLSLPQGTATPTLESVDSGRLQIGVSGSVTLPLVGKLPTVRASFSSGGWSFAAPLGDFSLPGASGDGSRLTDTVVGWSSFATSLKLVDPVTHAVTRIPLPANTFTVSGDFATPSWLRDLLKLNGDIRGRATGTFNLSSGDFALRMGFELPPSTYIYGDASTATNVRLTRTYFEIERKGSDFNLALGGAVTMSIAGSDSLPASSIDLGIALAFSATTQTVSGSFTLASEDGWQNAFGTHDLTLFDLAVSFQLNLTTLQPGIGFAARAVLPQAVRSHLAMPGGVRTTLVANISLTTPCLGISVDDPLKSGQNVLDLGGGALTAKEFELQIAPSGCTVGQFHYEPGLSLAFDGRIANVDVAIAAHLGLSPFALDATVDIGAFSIGGLDLDATHLEIALASSKLKIAFSGGAHVFGTSVVLSGGVQQSGTKTVLDFNGKLDNVPIAPVVLLKHLDVTAHVEVGASPELNFAAKGSIDLLGSTASADFRLGLANGALDEAHANVNATIRTGGPGGLVLDGVFTLDYAPNRPFSLDANVTASIGAYKLAAAKVSVRQSSLMLAADLDIRNVFRARLEGAVYYGDVPAGALIKGPGGGNVRASSGDFLLSARDVQLDLAGFRAGGTVEFGRAQGATWGHLATTLQLLGSGGNNSIAVSGSFRSDGDFTLSGMGNLDLAGTTARVVASVSKAGPQVSVHGDATLSVLGSTVALGGSFQYDGGTPRFRLTGSGNLALGDYRVDGARFFLSNFPVDAGFAAAVDVHAGSALNFSGRMTIVQNRYYLGANANLDLRVLTANANVVLTNCSDASCRFSAGGTRLQANAAISKAGFSFAVSVRVEPNGTFRATATSPVEGTYEGETSALWLAAVAFYADYRYRMQLTIQNTSPYVAVDGSGSANVYGRYWRFGWSDWERILGVDASISTEPLKVCADAKVWKVSFRRCG